MDDGRWKIVKNNENANGKFIAILDRIQFESFDDVASETISIHSQRHRHQRLQ